MLLPLNDLVLLLKEFKNEIGFRHPVIIKMSPHTWPVKIYSVVLENGIIYYLDQKFNKHEIKEPSEIVNTLIQRLKLLKHESI